jgi:hypothetical protein
LSLSDLRVIDLLEEMGTPDARQVLDDLAKASPNPQVAHAARAAQKRLTSFSNLP